MKYRCRRCQGTDLGVKVTVAATLYQFGGETVTEVDTEYQDKTWDDNSRMWCKSCGHSGHAYSFNDED